MVARLRTGNAFRERKTLQGVAGWLRELRALPITLKRYDKVTFYFLCCCLKVYGSVADNYGGLDDQVSAFMVAARDEGEPRAMVADVLPGLMLDLNTNNVIPTSWGWLAGWARSEMLQMISSPLISLCLAGCVRFASFGLHGLVALALVAFHCVLRTAEMLGIRVSHISFGA